MATITIESSDSVSLEARWDAPDEATHVLVFAHPHPLSEGTMNAPLMVKVTEALVAKGVAVLRFNFRGVGGSSGSHDYGEGEINDIAAAMAEAAATYPDLPLAIAGWSFGAATSLRWQARDGSAHTYVGIALPVGRESSPSLPTPSELLPAQRYLIIGDRDQFTTLERVHRYGTAIGAEVDLMRGSDHFFYFREGRVAAAVARALGVAET